MYCSHCGNQLEERARFCSHCGQEVEETRKAAPAPPPPPKKRRTGCILGVILGILITILILFLLIWLNVFLLPPAQTIVILPAPIEETWETIRVWQDEQGLDIPGVSQKINILPGGDDRAGALPAGEDQIVVLPAGEQADEDFACHWLSLGQFHNLQKTAGGKIAFSYRFPQDSRVDVAQNKQLEDYFCLYLEDDSCKPLEKEGLIGHYNQETDITDNLGKIMCTILQDEPAELWCVGDSDEPFSKLIMILISNDPQTGETLCGTGFHLDFGAAPVLDALIVPEPGDQTLEEFSCAWFSDAAVKDLQRTAQNELAYSIEFPAGYELDLQGDQNQLCIYPPGEGGGGCDKKLFVIDVLRPSDYSYSEMDCMVQSVEPAAVFCRTELDPELEPEGFYPYLQAIAQHEGQVWQCERLDEELSFDEAQLADALVPPAFPDQDPGDESCAWLDAPVIEMLKTPDNEYAYTMTYPAGYRVEIRDPHGQICVYSPGDIDQECDTYLNIIDLSRPEDGAWAHMNCALLSEDPASLLCQPWDEWKDTDLDDFVPYLQGNIEENNVPVGNCYARHEELTFDEAQLVDALPAPAASAQLPGDKSCVWLENPAIELLKTPNNEYAYTMTYPAGYEVEVRDPHDQVCIYSPGEIDQDCGTYLYKPTLQRGAPPTIDTDCTLQTEDPATLLCQARKEDVDEALDFLGKDNLDDYFPAMWGYIEGSLDPLPHCRYKDYDLRFDQAQLVDSFTPPDQSCPEKAELASNMYLVGQTLVLDVTLPTSMQTNPPQSAVFWLKMDPVEESYKIVTDIECEKDPKRSENLLCRISGLEIDLLEGDPETDLVLYQNNEDECGIASSNPVNLVSTAPPPTDGGDDGGDGGGGKCDSHGCWIGHEKWHSGWGCCSIGCWCDGGCYNDCPNCPPPDPNNPCN